MKKILAVLLGTRGENRETNDLWNQAVALGRANSSKKNMKEKYSNTPTACNC